MYTKSDFEVTRRQSGKLGYEFTDQVFLSAQKDEYYFRDRWNKLKTDYRKLSQDEIDQLQHQGNRSGDWNQIFVSEIFDPHLIWDCRFYGKIRIGNLEEGLLEYHDLKMPVGLYNSKIISCDLGDHVSIENVNYLSHYQIDQESALFNINEMTCSSHAKFGNGILKEGEPEKVRIWLELCNENAGRGVLPFEGMLAGDAFLWAKYRDDVELMEKFKQFTENRSDRHWGHYGKVGCRTVIKHCKILKDVKIGPHAYIKGANKLKNLTINSSSRAKTQIGEGVELVNGIIANGCRIFYGVKAVRFVMGENANLKYGARLINSYLGDNATISCCEVLNSLIFPGHEQHHNNSFLCAALIKGQSNMAAGATIGSNHNSRANDGELVAGRGFWPGLCVSLKHNSVFASYTLIAKGDYPYEIWLKLPFSLLMNDESEGALKIIPGFWFQYNMYALARNSWKYANRDNRTEKIQMLEFDYLAPDTVEEIFIALDMMEKWASASSAGTKFSDAHRQGREILLHKNKCDKMDILARDVEASDRPVFVLKAHEGYVIYLQAILLYAARAVSGYCHRERLFDWEKIQAQLSKPVDREWINVGGQLMSISQLEQLKTGIRSENIQGWEEVHQFYRDQGAIYTFEVACHAFKSMMRVAELKGEKLDIDNFVRYLQLGSSTGLDFAQRTSDSRKKDYERPFRKMTYENDSEMQAVLGKFEDNRFVERELQSAEKLNIQIEDLISKIS